MPSPDQGDLADPARPAWQVALVVTAAPLARRTRDIYDVLRGTGWAVTVCPTADADKWITNAPRHDYLNGRVRPNAVICCPATFNTLNKWAAGINDSPALGVLNDAIGLGTPLLVVPMVGERLSRHPVWPATLNFLTTAGISVLDPVTGQHTQTLNSIVSGTGDDIADAFDPGKLVDWLTKAGRA